MKKTVSLLVTLCFMMVMFCTPISAQTPDTTGYKVETPQEAYKLIDGVNKGDVDAINKLKSLKAFKKEEVNKALGNIKLTSADRMKSIKFDDGSEIVLGLEISTPAASDDRELQYAVEWQYYYQLKVAGIEVARYTVYMDYYSDGANCWGESSYDTGSGILVYSIDPLGTTDLITSGLYVKCRGQGNVVISFVVQYTVTLTCYGYPDPDDNWWTTSTS